MQTAIVIPYVQEISVTTDWERILTSKITNRTCADMIEFLVMRWITGDVTYAAETDKKVIFEKVEKEDFDDNQKFVQYTGRSKAFDQFEGTFILMPDASLTVFVSDKQNPQKTEHCYVLTSPVVLNACRYLLQTFRKRFDPPAGFLEVPAQRHQYWLTGPNRGRFDLNRRYVTVFFLIEAARLGLIPNEMPCKLDKITIHHETFEDLEIDYSDLDFDGTSYNAPMRSMIKNCIGVY